MIDIRTPKSYTDYLALTYLDRGTANVIRRDDSALTADDLLVSDASKLGQRVVIAH